jgi:hypothetical protein
MRTTERKAVLGRFRKNDEEPTPVDDLIERILEKMMREPVGTDEYSKMLGQLEQLYKIKGQETRETVSRDTLALIAGNLMGILLIVIYEQKHVMRSKGLSQIMRPR